MLELFTPISNVVLFAEVTSYDDYVQHGGENGAKEAGRQRLEGKDYIMQDGDIVHFRFNV